MNASDLRTLLDYHYWARNRMLDAVSLLTPEQFTRDLGSSFRSVRDTAAHLYGAEHAWYQRWHGTSPTALLAAEGFPDVGTLRHAWTEHEAAMRRFLEDLGEDGINRGFEFNSLDGRPGSQLFSQCIQHIVNHGSYHRGQITTMLRQMGATPPKAMDMAAFYRVQPKG